MKINLNVSEDAELRAEIKKMIAGQVKSASRQEFREMIVDSLGKNAISKETVNKLLIDKIAVSVRNATSENVWGDSDLKKVTKEIRVAVAKVVDEMRPEIKEIISSHISRHFENTVNSTIEEIISEKVKSAISRMIK